MKLRRTSLATIAIMIASASLVGCRDERSRGNERWVTTENTTVAIDWDKINQAYKEASGPEDFEKRVNEIYEGDEVISVAVQDLDDKTQVVTGFFDKNTSGTTDDGEKIFTIQRDVKAEGSGQYQITGHGAYGYYHSPVWDIATGMLLGSMISSAFRPNYVPMYTQPYVTPTSRASDLRTYRNDYRAQNPSRFTKSSGSGRTYNSTGSRSWGSGSGSTGGSRRSGGGRFGIRRQSRDRKPERLTA